MPIARPARGGVDGRRYISHAKEEVTRRRGLIREVDLRMADQIVMASLSVAKSN
jgi:hypothetical protein